MSVQVINAGYEHAQTIHDLANNIWREHYPGIISKEQIDYMLQSRYAVQYLKNLMQQGEKFFLCIEDDLPIGFYSYTQRSTDYFLNKFYLSKSKHRGGVGTIMFNHLLTQIEADNVPLRLQVNRKNLKAINFYFKQGFVIEEVKDFDIGGGYLMEDFVMLRARTES